MTRNSRDDEIRSPYVRLLVTWRHWVIIATNVGLSPIKWYLKRFALNVAPQKQTRHQYTYISWYRDKQRICFFKLVTLAFGSLTFNTDWMNTVVKGDRSDWMVSIDYWSQLACADDNYSDAFMFSLTPLPLVPHICVSESGQHWFR